MKHPIVLSPDIPHFLLPWFRENARDFPWRRTKDPYAVWISEIMLQQTRAETVKSYYTRFMEEFPTLAALGVAPPDTVLKLWEGLGYYSRARNLHRTAQIITTEHAGIFPREWNAIRALPGIGDYTAAAVSSICFDAPTPAVDGNVIRVASRLISYPDPADTPYFRKTLTDTLKAIAVQFPGERGHLTAAWMELGATVCLPNGAPHCDRCPLAPFCSAYAQGKTRSYPIRTPKPPRRHEIYTVFLLRCGDNIAIRRRPDDGLLAGLWEYPNIPGAYTEAEAIAIAQSWNCRPISIVKTRSRHHIFTHIEWDLNAFFLTCAEMPDAFVWKTAAEIAAEYSLPAAFRKLYDPRTDSAFF